MPEEIPRKLFFKIGEVCQLTDTQPYVLRFWESEFPQLAPTKSRSGQRLYRRKDIDLVLEIKKLLYEEGFTIAGARKKLGMPEGQPVLEELFDR
ncbi:MAG TPA: MerR family transcriptional regulator, partial [Candidatus Polarisedimenticolia bacterium]|nr:MerR family transcriptional regulator [Candidatus Polarisedimenticolia bacterium]